MLVTMIKTMALRNAQGNDLYSVGHEGRRCVASSRWPRWS